jgi:hypothetical protein
MIINYCPEGKAMSDFEDIERFIIESYLNNQEISTSSQSVVEMGRILYMEGKIDSLQAKFNGQTIGIRDDGMFECWPYGFCDLAEMNAQRLILLMANRYEKEKSQRKEES